MRSRIVVRRGTDLQRQTVKFAEGELAYTTDTKKVYVGDGRTFGGILVSGSGGGGGTVSWDDITGKPMTFTPSAHTHTPAEAGADPVGTASAAVAAHVVAADPHGQYRLESQAVTWDEITGKPSTFTPSAHTHLASHITDVDLTNLPLNYLGNSTGSKTLTLGPHDLQFNFTAAGGSWRYNWTGAASGHLFELKQETGNVAAGTHLLHVEASDPDATCLHLHHNNAAGFALLGEGLARWDSKFGILMDPTGTEALQVSGAVWSSSWFHSNRTDAADQRNAVLFSRGAGTTLSISVTGDGNGNATKLHFGTTTLSNLMTLDVAGNKAGVLRIPTTYAFEVEGRIAATANAAAVSTLTAATIGLTASGRPQLVLVYAGGGTNEKVWDLTNIGSTLYGRCFDDAVSGASNWLEVTRSGTTVSYVRLDGKVGVVRTPTTYAFEVNGEGWSTTRWAVGNFDGSANETGWAIYAPASSASVYYDIKVKTGGYIYHQCGTGTEAGNARQWLVVNPENGRARIGGGTPTTHVLEVLGSLLIQSNTMFPAGDFSVLLQGDDNRERLCVRSSNVGVISVQKGRGTVASPSALLSEDTLGSYHFGGYDGSAWVRSSWIAGYAAENWSGTNRGSYLTFNTTPVGSTSIAERMRITAAGNVGIGMQPIYTLNVRTATDKNIGVITNGSAIGLYSHNDANNALIPFAIQASEIQHRIGSGNVLAMTVDSNAYVKVEYRLGIGMVPTGSEALQINGDVACGQVLSSSRAKFGWFDNEVQSSHPTVTNTAGTVFTYVKGVYYVIAYRVDSSNMKYRYLDLSSTNPTWIYSTSAP